MDSMLLSSWGSIAISGSDVMTIPKHPNIHSQAILIMDWIHLPNHHVAWDFESCHFWSRWTSETLSCVQSILINDKYLTMTRHINKIIRIHNTLLISRKAIIVRVITITTSRPLDTNAPSRFWRYVLPSRISVTFHCKQLDMKGKLKIIVWYPSSNHPGIQTWILSFQKSFLSGVNCIFFYWNVTRDSWLKRTWYKVFQKVSSMIPLLETINVANEIQT